MDKYRYGMKFRGFSIGCQPMRGLRDVTEDRHGIYHNILGYDRQLEPREVEEYELTYLGKEEVADKHKS